MAAFNRALVLATIAVGLAAALGACANKVPDNHWAGERQTWRGWQGTWDAMTGWREWAPAGIQHSFNQPQREPGCTLWSQRRVTSQSGVNDYLDYDLCADSPYPAYLGERMSQ